MVEGDLDTDTGFLDHRCERSDFVSFVAAAVPRDFGANAGQSASYIVGRDSGRGGQALQRG